MKSNSLITALLSENMSPGNSKISLKKSYNNPFPQRLLNLEATLAKSNTLSFQSNTFKLPIINKRKHNITSKSKKCLALYCKASFLKKFLQEDFKITLGEHAASPSYDFPKRSSIAPLNLFKKDAVRKVNTTFTASPQFIDMNSRNEFPLRNKKENLIRSINLLKQYSVLHKKASKLRSMESIKNPHSYF